LGLGGGPGKPGEVPGEVDGLVPIRHGELLLDVFGDVDEDRAGAAGGGDEEGFGDDAGNVVDVEDEVVVLGDGSGDFDDGGFLEGVGANHAPGDLAGDGDDGDAVH